MTLAYYLIVIDYTDHNGDARAARMLLPRDEQPTDNELRCIEEVQRRYLSPNATARRATFPDGTDRQPHRWAT